MSPAPSAILSKASLLFGESAPCPGTADIRVQRNTVIRRHVLPPERPGDFVFTHSCFFVIVPRQTCAVRYSRNIMSVLRMQINYNSSTGKISIVIPKAPLQPGRPVGVYWPLIPASAPAWARICFQTDTSSIRIHSMVTLPLTIYAWVIPMM